MDPTVAWRKMCAHMFDGDVDEAQEYAEALQGWLKSGGFAPKGINGALALDVARVVSGCKPASWVDQS